MTGCCGGSEAAGWRLFEGAHDGGPILDGGFLAGGELDGELGVAGVAQGGDAGEEGVGGAGEGGAADEFGGDEGAFLVLDDHEVAAVVFDPGGVGGLEAAGAFDVAGAFGCEFGGDRGGVGQAEEGFVGGAMKQDGGAGAGLGDGAGRVEGFAGLENAAEGEGDGAEGGGGVAGGLPGGLHGGHGAGAGGLVAHEVDPAGAELGGEGHGLGAVGGDVQGDGIGGVDEAEFGVEEADFAALALDGGFDHFAAHEGGDDADVFAHCGELDGAKAHGATAGEAGADAEIDAAGGEFVEGYERVGGDGGDAVGGDEDAGAEADSPGFDGGGAHGDEAVRAQHLGVVEPGVAEAEGFGAGDGFPGVRVGGEGDAELHDGDLLYLVETCIPVLICGARFTVCRAICGVLRGFRAGCLLIAKASRSHSLFDRLMIFGDPTKNHQALARWGERGFAAGHAGLGRAGGWDRVGGTGYGGCATSFGWSMPLSVLARQRLLFAFLCFVWGVNWVAMKIGVTDVPPGFFSGTRWTFAGAAFLLWRYFTGEPVRVAWRLIPRLFWLSQILITINVFIMLYGLRYVSSGLASVLSSALTPLALLGFSVAMGQERFNRRQGAACGGGGGGMVLLFGPKIAQDKLDLMEGLGALGIIIGNLSYCLGSVLSRPLMRTVPPAVLAASTNLMGGLTLLVISIAVEPGVGPVLTGDWGLHAWLAWTFMVFAGSLGATTIYFILVRDWGASTTGTYAFISPVISVAAGMAILGEQVDLVEAGGMALMLAAAAMVLRKG